MPDWGSSDARRHNKRTRKNATAARAFAHAANSAADLSEGAQVRIGNFAASRAGSRSKRKSRRA
jgi:hypothetical protein